MYDCREPAGREAGLAAATTAVDRGELVVLPTDTVYGVGADPLDPAAVDRLLRAKGRGRDRPSPVLVADRGALAELVADIPAGALALAAEFWPGPLTIVVEHRADLGWDLGQTGGTVAVRMPDHPVALDLLRRTGPLAVSSANLHGEPPATTAAAARDQLGGRVAVYLEAGPTPGPVPSTIVSLAGDVPHVLRAGALAVERIREVLPDLAG